MFQQAIKDAQQYTLPVVISYRRQDGSTDSNIATFMVLNKEGWVLTAAHVVRLIAEYAEEVGSYRKHESSVAEIQSGSGTTVQRKRRLRSLPRLPKNVRTNYSPWWGRDGWSVDLHYTDIMADIAIGRISDFDASLAGYPVFKNPDVGFDVGINLCKLGFPFHNITPNFDDASRSFRLPPDALPMPLFPIEGIYTRSVTQIIKDGNTEISRRFVETSSPGLRGQSGGPTFDKDSRIWAMQSRTEHYPLDFSPRVPNHRSREHQFLNSGMGTHAGEILSALKSLDIDVEVSKD